ncbi:MAG: RecB family exonuclease [Anaerolineae bacterium]
MGWTYSYSQFEKFNLCPRSYFEAYCAQAPQVKTPELELGELAHRAIERVITGKIRPDQVLDWAVAQSSGTLWLGEKEAAMVADWTARFFDAFRSDGEIACEKEFKAEVDGIPVKVRIDILQRVKNRVIITDLKTNTEAYEPLDTMQIPLYAWVVGRALGVEQVEGRLWFLRYSFRPMRAEVLTPAETEKARAWAVKTAQEIEAARAMPGLMGFPERPGAGCRVCGTPLQCSSIYPSCGDYTRMTEPEAKEMAGYAIRLEAALNLLKKYLQNYLTQSQARSIAVNDEHWGNYPKAVYRLASGEKVKELFEVIVRAGKDPWEFLSVNPWTLLRRDNQEIRAWLEANASKTVEPYFTHRERPPEEAA